MPDFDFERKVGLKIQLQKFRRSVVLMVVDVAGGRAMQALVLAAWGACVAGGWLGVQVWVGGRADGRAGGEAAAARGSLRCTDCPLLLTPLLPCPPTSFDFCADFDGSLPQEAIRSILPPDMREGPLDVDKALPLGFRLLVAVNKADLLPKQVTPARLEVGGPGYLPAAATALAAAGAGAALAAAAAAAAAAGPCPDSALPRLPACLPQKWVRKRMAQGGLPRPSAVHIVSSTKQRGVRELLADLQSAVGLRGDVWVVGAQVCSEACFGAPPAAGCLACMQHHMPTAANSQARSESQARKRTPALVTLAALDVPALALPLCLAHPTCRMRARAR